jgi:hypothetical protein
VNIDVPAAAITAIGLQGSTLHSIADVDSSGLGLQTAEVAAIRQSLVDVLHRANATPPLIFGNGAQSTAAFLTVGFCRSQAAPMRS